MEKCYQKFDLKWRRNHIAEIVGDHMFIYGGIDEDGKYLNDMWILDLTNFIWAKVHTNNWSYKTPAVAFHSSAMVFTYERREHKNFKFNSFSEVPKQRLYQKVFYFKLTNLD